jgi:eukaryotic-like serine/threonine-protein kinase
VAVTQEFQQLTEPRLIAGRYAVLEEIGRGGMGVVWLAEDRTIGRRVAIKELHLPAGVPDAERAVLRERVLREARAAGRLNDPAVVTVYDVLQDAGGTYIVMELIQAPTLAEIVRQRGPLPPAAVTQLAEQLLSALEAAHAAGVVHRDVKPSNIMVSETGRVKLTDFGIAQSLDDPRLTSSGILVGSPTYLAPERIKGADADARSDLWSLAAVLFFAVEGASPFERSSTAATMHAIVNEVPYLTRCHGPLASAIMGLLNTTPSARLTAAQVRQLLTQAAPTPPQGEQTVVASGYQPPTMMATAPSRLGRPARRLRWWALAGVVVLLAGAFAGGWFTHQGVAAAGDDAMLPTFSYGKGGGQVPRFELSYGNCAAAPLREGRSYPSDNTVACADPHEFEVVSAFDPYNDTEIDYPGEDRLRIITEQTCGWLFGSNRVRERDRETLQYRALYPTKAAWGNADDEDRQRNLVCVVSDRDGNQLDASVIDESD